MKKKVSKKTKSRSGNSSKSKSHSNSMRSQSKGDIATLILRDHKPIKELILILKNPDVSFAKKQPAFVEFERVLTCHAKAEEESLYVHLKEEDNTRVEGLEGDTEHNIAERLMAEVNASADDEDTWMAKVKVLAEVVDHHVKEEEKEVLKAGLKDFTSDERIVIGEMYSRLFNKYSDDNGEQKKYLNRQDLRAEYV